VKNQHVTKCDTGPHVLTDFFGMMWQQKMDVRFGMWNVWSLYRAGSVTTVGSKLAKYNVGLVVVQEVRWDNGGSEPVDSYTFFSGCGNANHCLGQAFFFVHKGIISAVMRAGCCI
jgi:hypothetical protein